MTDSNNVIATVFTAMGMVITDFYSHLAPWLLMGLALCACDLRFGVLAARARGEEIRPSRAVRRTVNKVVDYLSWVTLAELASRTFGLALGVPVVSIGTLFIIYGIEFNSCMNNYFEYKGIKGRFNLWKLMSKKNLSEVIEEEGGDE